MKSLFENLFPTPSDPEPEQRPAGEQETAPVPAAAPHLAQQSQQHALRLELEQREATIHRLQAEVERLRARQDRLLGESLQARLEALFAELAGPLVQLRTQEALEAQGKPVQARDVLAVARRLMRALERSGVTLEGAPGDCVAYDPLRHAPLDKYARLEAGQPVVVRFAGAVYQGKLLQKAMVEAGGPCQDV